MTPDEIAEYLRGPHLATMATIRADGSPHLTPVWYHHDGERFLVIVEPTSVKVRNIRRDPRVALCIPTHQAPYHYVRVDGRAEVLGEPDRDLFLDMSIRYLGEKEGREYTAKTLAELVFCTLAVTPSRVIGVSDKGS